MFILCLFCVFFSWQNESYNNSQGSVPFEPVSNTPLFDAPATSRQYSAPEQPPPKQVLGKNGINP